MFGFLKSAFQKEKSPDDMSVAELEQHIAAHAPRQKELHDLLARAGADEAARNKSVLWHQQMAKRVEEANGKQDYPLATKLEAEIAEARKRAKKIQDGAQVMIDELNSIEDDIELMTRAIDQKKR
jgi:hypothetical protein